MSKYYLVGKIARIIAIILFGLLSIGYVFLALFSIGKLATSTTVIGALQIISIYFDAFFFCFGLYIAIKKKRQWYLFTSLGFLGLFLFGAIDRFFLIPDKTTVSYELLNQTYSFILYAVPCLLLFLSYKFEPNALPQEPSVDNVLNAEKEPFSPLSYQGLSVRGSAVIIDQLILFSPIYLIVYLIDPSLWQSQKSTITILSVCLWIIYMIVMEGNYQGQSVGKKLCHIKVMMVDGKPVTFKAAIIRNFVRPFELIFGGYLIPILFIAFSKKKQRPGDFFAKTVVVKA